MMPSPKRGYQPYEALADLAAFSLVTRNRDQLNLGPSPRAGYDPP
jgi:hypothetical protein